MVAGADAQRRALRQLAGFYRHGGYVRGPIPQRLLRDGWRIYKKGWELRLVLPDQETLAEVQRLIDAAGLRLARPHRKGSRIVQPIYQREQVLEVLRAAGMDVRGL